MTGDRPAHARTTRWLTVAHDGSWPLGSWARSPQPTPGEVLRLFYGCFYRFHPPSTKGLNNPPILSPPDGGHPPPTADNLKLEQDSCLRTPAGIFTFLLVFSQPIKNLAHLFGILRPNSLLASVTAMEADDPPPSRAGPMYGLAVPSPAPPPSGAPVGPTRLDYFCRGLLLCSVLFELNGLNGRGPLVAALWLPCSQHTNIPETRSSAPGSKCRGCSRQDRGRVRCSVLC